jgi:general secretion pathway protein I
MMKRPLKEMAVHKDIGIIHEGRGQEGFTLLEVMAAIAILGIGIVMVIQLFSGGLGLAKASDDYTRKVLVAKEKMADSLLPEKLEEGVRKGVTDDGFSWSVEISPYDLKKADSGAKARIFKVVVSAGGPGARENRFTITTLKTIF